LRKGGKVSPPFEKGRWGGISELLVLIGTEKETEERRQKEGLT